MAFTNLSAEPFMPYENNGGSALAIAGPDFVVVGGDTRLNAGMSILSRHQNKVHELTKDAVIAITGSSGDALSLLKVLRDRVENYTVSQMKNMKTESLAQMVSIIMYNKRFLPYNVFNIVAGLDSNGKGAAYTYDALGHFQRHPFCSIGSAGAIIMPILDAIIGNNIESCFKKGARNSSLTLLLAQNVCKEAFRAAAERDVYTADYLIMRTITSNGICTEEIPLTKN